MSLGSDASTLQRVWRWIGWIAAAALTVVMLIDTFLPDIGLVGAYLKHLLFMGLIYSILSVSLNFVVGYIGQTSLGHAAFYGFGAYASGMLMFYSHLSFWIAFPIAGALSGLVGWVLGLPSLRVKGPFLVIVTYGFGEMLRFVAINLKSTGGPAGLPGIPSPAAWLPFDQMGATGKEAFIFLAFFLLAVLVFVAQRIVGSPIGRAFAAIKTDEIAAGAMGINVNFYKLMAFTIAAVFAGLAGSLYASYLSYVSPDILSSNESILILAMVIIGGAGSIFGSIAGAFTLVLVPELFKQGKDMLALRVDPWTTLFGLLLILAIRFRPNGLLVSKRSSR